MQGKFLFKGPLSKIYFFPRTTDPAEIFRRCVPWPGQLIIKVSAQNIGLFKSYSYNKPKKIGPRLSQMSPPNLMIQIWGWC